MARRNIESIQLTKRFSAIRALLSWVVLGWFAGYPAQVSAQAWSSEDRARELVYLAINAMDWMQTRHIAKNPEYHEWNPILGPHPTTKEVDRYFAVSIPLKLLIADQLPPPWRERFQWFTIAFNGALVAHNTRIGIEPSGSHHVLFTFQYSF